MSRKALRLLVFGLVNLLVLSTLSIGLFLPYAKAYGLVHPARSFPVRTPADIGIPQYQAVEFFSSDGLLLRGWYIPPRNGAVVIFVHGLGGNRNEVLDEAGLVVERGYGALLFDLRNHGESAGYQTTLGLYEVNDVRGAVEYILARPGVDPDKVGLFGHSMGGATVLMAAAQIPQVSFVIAESAYTSLEDNIAEGVKSLTGLPPVPFGPLVVFFGVLETRVELQAVRPVDVIRNISPRPLLLIHGELDPTVPAENSRKLYAAAGEPKQLYIIPNAGHGGFLQADPGGYPAVILEFLEISVFRQTP